MKRTVAIIAGGDSSEHEVSMNSAKGIYSFIDKERYNLYIVELSKKAWEAVLADGSRSTVDKNDFSFMDGDKKIKPDFAYITIHGTPGENGILQGYFELLDIPYSTCDVLVSAMTFSKFTLNQYLKGFGIRVAESMLVNKRFGIEDKDVVEKIGLPCFIKPNASGSSFGVTKVKTVEQIQPALQAAFAESDDVMIEAFMDGIELANGCYKTKDKSVVFPITEVVSDKIPALLVFFPEIALHITRPVRWDSDHVVLFDDETREMAKEIVRCGGLDGRVKMALDYFDASVNRVAAWTLGFRNWQKALLNALLTPSDSLKADQDAGNLTAVLVRQDELKTMPFGDVWDEYCRRCGAPADGAWLDTVLQYERDVLSKR